ncbi:MAG: aldo/keto reductase [Fimbriimonas sp.]|nr:aldo/keto reductase [Fimbriimonas sp.]
MRYRKFGKHGVDVSEVGFGAWAIGGSWGPQSDGDSVESLAMSLDMGVNFIDTAAGYGGGKSERIIGHVLRERGSQNVFVATKTPPTAGDWPPSPYDVADDRYPESYLRTNVEERLQCLGAEKIDLLQLHTWTRAWNRRPTPFDSLRKLQQEGKIGLIGVSTPEHDQNSVIDLMRGGHVDAVQVIYNIFEQEPAAELLDVAGETGTGVIVRVVFDEGALTGKFTADTRFAEDDFRNNYFAGDRLIRVVKRVEAIRSELEGSRYTLAEAAVKFALAHPAVSTVIPGMRNARQAELNCSIPDLPDIPSELLAKLRRHNWRRAFWYAGKG